MEMLDKEKLKLVSFEDKDVLFSQKNKIRDLYKKCINKEKIIISRL